MQPVQMILRSRLDQKTVHPGLILLRCWLHPLDLSQNELARMMGVSPRRVNEIVLGRRAITAGSALRLSNALGVAPQYWLALQADYELHRAKLGLPERNEPPSRVAPLSENGRLAKRNQAIHLALDQPELRGLVTWDDPHAATSDAT